MATFSVLTSLMLLVIMGVMMVRGDGDNMTMLGPLGLRMAVELDSGSIKVCRGLPYHVPRKGGDTQATNATDSNTTTTTMTTTTKPPEATSKTDLLEFTLKSLQQVDDGKKLEEAALSDCMASKTVMKAPHDHCRLVTCQFGKDVQASITLCPLVFPADKSFLLIQVHLPSYQWCPHANASYCPAISEVVLQAEVETTSDKGIAKLEKDGKMLGLNSSVEHDVVPFKAGPNSSRVFISKQYLEDERTENLKTTLTLPKSKHGVFTLKIKHATTSQNSSLTFQIGLDPGYEKAKVPGKVVNVATVAKAAILDCLLAFAVAVFMLGR